MLIFLRIFEMKSATQSGRSMVEMLGVLAIIGVLSVGGIAGYSKAMNKYKINKTTDQVSMLVANLRTLFSSQGNYDGLDNESAIRFGVVPNDMYSTASTATPGDIKNAFNGEVTIKAAQARKADVTAGKDGTETGGKEAFVIVYEGLSQEACVTIATGDWGSGQASGLIGIAAGQSDQVEAKVDALLIDDNAKAAKPTTAGSVVAAQPGVTASPTPISVTSAVLACDGGNAGSGYGVAWKYY